MYWQKQIRVASSIAGVAVALLAITAAKVGPKVPECELARIWVNGHKSALPSTLAELSGFPMTYRKAIYAALPTATQKGLWQDHLRSFISEDSPLTSAQKAAVALVASNLDAYWGADPRFRFKRPDVLADFDTPLARRIFATLGPEPGLSSRASLYVAAKVGLPSPLANCECQAGGWEGCWVFSCQAGGCTPVESDCGFLWMYTCDGLCGG